MRIESIEFREIHIKARDPFVTSFGCVQDRRILLVRVSSGGMSGWGECTAWEGPFYNHEATDLSWTVIRDFAAPMVLGREIASAAHCGDLMRAIRGHRMARAAIETAAWDLEARMKGIPLWRLLGGARAEVECGVAIGIQPTIHALIEKIGPEISAGYRRIKIKIKPGFDVEAMRAARKEFPDAALMADANSAYTLGDADRLSDLDALDLIMIEQPLADDDLVDHAELQRRIRTPVCLDESIHHAEDARKAISLGACRIINVKLGRVGGHQEARRVHDLCRARGVPLWCGGMHETGIGRAHNIAMATLPGFTLPGDLPASKVRWFEDVVDPEIEVTPRGTIPAPKGPGIGYRVREDRVEALTARKETLAG